MRTILQIHVQNFAAQADAIVFGLIIGQAQQLGTTTLLANQAHLDWYFYEYLFPTSSGAAASEDVMERFDFDVRSKRKATELQQVPMICFENLSAASKNVDVFTKTLLALP
jgi:hypothetical protein